MYIYNGIFSAAKKKEILLFATIWIDLRALILNEVSQADKDKYHMISLNMWNLKTAKQAHGYREQKGGWKRCGVIWVKGLKRHKLSIIK